MNNTWKRQIHKILGTFWDRVFTDRDIVGWLSESMSYVYRMLSGVYNDTECSRRINKTPELIPIKYPVFIPKSVCIHNAQTIGSYTLSGSYTVSQTSTHKQIKIPVEYFPDNFIIQDLVINPNIVWVKSINMHIDASYVTIDLPDTDILHECVEASDSDIVSGYRLYVTKYPDSPDYNANFGELMGIDISQFTPDVARMLWALYTKGPTLNIINWLISESIGNDVCEHDGVITRIWKDHGTYNVLTDNGSLYHGQYNPIVSVGDSVQVGDLLFDGLTVVTKDNIPDASVTPGALLKTPYGYLQAINKVIPTISGAVGKVIPDMGNSVWAEAIARSQELGVCGDLLEPGSDSCNPFSYLFTNMFPGTGYQFILRGDKPIDVSLLSAINSLVVHGISVIGSTLAEVSIMMPVNSQSINTAPVSSIHTQVSMISPHIGEVVPVCRII